MAILKAKRDAIAKAEAEEQAKIDGMTFSEATEYLREHDGSKAKQEAEEKAINERLE